jgi:hypothetical protein
VTPVITQRFTTASVCPYATIYVYNFIDNKVRVGTDTAPFIVEAASHRHDPMYKTTYLVTVGRSARKNSATPIIYVDATVKQFTASTRPKSTRYDPVFGTAEMATNALSADDIHRSILWHSFASQRRTANSAARIGLFSLKNWVKREPKQMPARDDLSSMAGGYSCN